MFESGSAGALSSHGHEKLAAKRDVCRRPYTMGKASALFAHVSTCVLFDWYQAAGALRVFLDLLFWNSIPAVIDVDMWS